MIFTLIFLGGLVAGWLLCAYIPWLALSVATRGGAGIGMLPVCLAAGLVGALAVPALGADGTSGLWASFAIAFGLSALLLALRRYAFGTRAAAPAKEPE